MTDHTTFSSSNASVKNSQNGWTTEKICPAPGKQWVHTGSMPCRTRGYCVKPHHDPRTWRLLLLALDPEELSFHVVKYAAHGHVVRKAAVTALAVKPRLSPSAAAPLANITTLTFFPVKVTILLPPLTCFGKSRPSCPHSDWKHCAQNHNGAFQQCSMGRLRYEKRSL